MSGFTEHQAPDASNSPGRREVVYNLGTARRLLPLLRQIVGDLVSSHQRRARLAPELFQLDRGKNTLDWAGRQRRYQIREELESLEQSYRDVLAELDELGVVLIDPAEGRVGLPSVVNRQLAYFSWKLGEESLRYWHFPGESIRRLIPASWKEFGEMRSQINAT